MLARTLALTKGSLPLFNGKLFIHKSKTLIDCLVGSGWMLLSQLRLARVSQASRNVYSGHIWFALRSGTSHVARRRSGALVVSMNAGIHCIGRLWLVLRDVGIIHGLAHIDGTLELPILLCRSRWSPTWVPDVWLLLFSHNDGDHGVYKKYQQIGNGISEVQLEIL